MVNSIKRGVILIRRNRRASLELSIRAIVIVILAMTLLGLGLGFIRNMFADIGGISTDVTQQIRQQILDDLITNDKKISFPKTQILIDKGGAEILTVGVRNKGNAPLDYFILFEPKLDNTGERLAESVIEKWFKYAPAYSGESEVVPPAEAVVKNIRLEMPKSVDSGSYFLQFQIINSLVPDNDPEYVYASKDFFIVVRG